ncbi:MAG: Na+/H+ antiporter NhaC family protein [Lachnospiraceae bacterium]
MNEKRYEKNYGGKALFPLLLFLGLYVGCGAVFLVQGVEKPFNIISRYVAMMAGILAALFFYAKDKTIAEKTEIYCENAGRPGVMQLGLIVLMAGAFASGATAAGGKESIVNLGVSLIPSHFLVPGIFIMCAIISTCIGTSMGTLAAMVPVAFALAEGAGLNPAMCGAACIGGSFFGDNLSMISDTTITATKGVGAEMKDKFRMNFLIALPAAVITVILYTVLSINAGSSAVTPGDYNILACIPYVAVLILAVAGLDVVLVLAIGLGLSGVIGVLTGACTILDWVQQVSAGIEGMFWLAVFSMLTSGLVGLVRYYGGIEWLVDKVTRFIKDRKSCEYVICTLTLLISSVILNNVMAIMISAPIAKEMGEKFKIAPKRLASLLDIGACVAIMLVPHGTAGMMVQEAANANYMEILPYLFYPFLLLICTAITIQLGLMKDKSEA